MIAIDSGKRTWMSLWATRQRLYECREAPNFYLGPSYWGGPSFGIFSLTTQRKDTRQQAEPNLE